MGGWKLELLSWALGFAALSGGLALGCGVGSDTVQSVAYDMGGQEKPAVQVIRSQTDWQAVWSQLHREPELPFDPATQDGVAIHLGLRNSGGYRMELVEVVPEGEGVLVRWREITPAPGRPVTMVITSPVLIATFPKVPGAIRTEKTAGPHAVSP